MYCGVPVLVSDIPQTKEQVVEGENGFIIPVNNPEALLKRMSELSQIDSLIYEKMVQKTLISHREISLSNVCNELVKIYKSLLNND
jgi:glycosyltransferase involved in cell wall biosynthesis